VILNGDTHCVRIDSSIVTHCELAVPRNAGWSWSIELSWFGDGRRRLGSIVLTDVARIPRAMTDLGANPDVAPPISALPAPLVPRAATSDDPWLPLATSAAGARNGLLACLAAQQRDQALNIVCVGLFSSHHYSGRITTAAGAPTRFSGEGFCMSLLTDRVATLEWRSNADGNHQLRARDSLGCSVSLTGAGEAAVQRSWGRLLKVEFGI
jgi:hypothetical protein